MSDSGLVSKTRLQIWLPIAASLLPILVFTLIEELYGTKIGLIAGVVFGVIEVIFEYKKFGRPQMITLVANGLVFILGAVSLFESNAIFFKLQPALMVFMMAGALLVSSMLGKPFLVELAKKQRPDLPELALSRLAGLNLRLGVWLTLIALLGVYAAFEWSTTWWAAYKAVGAPVLLILYVLMDLAILKRRGRKQHLGR